ncbi:glycine zipper 2TM domain-containing protein [Pararhodobacter sp. SW119]|uniref:glycine zipper 2TM domain-containing protein n=1 Tax=Pararhodobacter sp. SW119 TaxID=2780075 RepID=UPI001ADF1B45|nr:glycine zipper 2TM domain-containing protein [Pararhodobacter sp. SW119]
MSKIFATGILAATIALGGCQLTQTERQVIGGIAGAGAGLIAADALNANPNWTILAALGGAAAGSMVARNTRTNECAYAVGDGTYRVGRC